jgi:hypothetical protein
MLLRNPLASASRASPGFRALRARAGAGGSCHSLAGGQCHSNATHPSSVALNAALGDNAAMRERQMIDGSVAIALGMGALGVSLQWTFMTVVYSSLGTLVLGLAATRLIALITARLHRTEKVDS